MILFNAMTRRTKRLATANPTIKPINNKANSMIAYFQKTTATLGILLTVSVLGGLL